MCQLILPYDVCILNGFLFFVMGNNQLIGNPNSMHLECEQAVIVTQIELQKTSLKDEFNFTKLVFFIWTIIKRINMNR